MNFSIENLTVNQSPSNITVNEGDSAQIPCCWNETGYRAKVAWFINDTKLSGVNKQRQENQTQICSTLHFTNILKNYTGHYVCEVTQDIPFLVRGKGNGTALSVSVRHLEKTTTGVNKQRQENQTQICSTLHFTNILKNYTGHYVCEVTQDIPVLVQGKGNGTALSVSVRHLERTTTGTSLEVVMIYIFRSLPFICLLMAFFYLNRDDKKATVSKPVEHSVESGGPDENLEAGETQRNETEEIKQGEKVSEQENGRDDSEKPEVTAATEEEKNEEKETVVVLEQGTPVQHNENKSVSVLDTEEKTNLMADVEDVTVSVLGGIVSAL
ncbi:hypothetical protein DPX16_3863 [Anabarilius grahami]|uniref:Ig-like domain-containing protein n=1 Tax=Anabarilius grahami TaxID=495550 RepID=A0A3N0XUV7_ANAGA|nr:hypothetical protein DPX16_3863 [Anabarilius grahami]